MPEQVGRLWVAGSALGTPTQSLGEFFSPDQFRGRSLEHLYVCSLCTHIKSPPRLSCSAMFSLYIFFLILSFEFFFFFLQLLKNFHGKNNSLYDTYTQSGAILYIIKDENSHFP